VKIIFVKFIAFLLSLIASGMLFYFVISEIIMRFMQSSNALGLIIIFVIACIFYMAAVSIITKKVNKSYINIIAILYFLGLIGITFFKSSYSNTIINMNPLSILDEFKNYFNHTLLLLITNVLIYIPFGMYIKYKTKIRGLKMFLSFLLYIFLVELIQLISHSGIFDINDIIINTLGFYIGVLCAKSIKYYSGKRNVKSGSGLIV